MHRKKKECPVPNCDYRNFRQPILIKKNLHADRCAEKMKNFNKQIFYISTVIFGLLLIPVFLAVGAEDEGTLGTSPFWIFLSKLSFLFRFPLFTIFGSIIEKFSGTFIILVLMFNTMFYGAEFFTILDKIIFWL
jgi:hypothetical protein